MHHDLMHHDLMHHDLMHHDFGGIQGIPCSVGFPDVRTSRVEVRSPRPDQLLEGE